jgi:hypothetical protein
MIASQELGEFVADAAGGAGDEHVHEVSLAGLGAGLGNQSPHPDVAKDATSGWGTGQT